MKDKKVGAVEIQEELKESYLNYAMSVIVSRALPDVRDGLKPSQRRILAAMNDLGLTPQSKTRKCAKICGDTSGNYHPHGEQVIYPTLVRMAQEFSLRYPLVIGQGNFGSIDGDPPAQMRYTEAKLSEAAMEMLSEMEENTVDLVPNYDETRKEPVVLPGRFPNLLVNGATGIAVGMSTSIPCHNIQEVCNCLLLMIERPDSTTADIFTLFKGPDFPTGGYVTNGSQLRQIYDEGRGIVRIRAKASVEKSKVGETVVVTEIPYGITKAEIIKDIVEQVNDGRLEGISDVRDESDKKGIRIVITPVKGASAEFVIGTLFRKTRLELSFSVNFIVLRDKTPVLLNFRELLLEYIAHRREVITRRSEFRLTKAKDELHIKEGILKALDVIDEIISIIRKSQDSSQARASLMERFSFTDKQVEAILKITLSRLTRLEKDTLLDEIGALKRQIDELTAILSDPERLKSVMKAEVIAIRERFKDPRRTRISDVERGEGPAAQEKESVLVVITRKGFCKRVYSRALGSRKSFSIQDTKNQDEVTVAKFAMTGRTLFMFSNKGRAYSVPVGAIYSSDKGSRGKSITQLISLADGEFIVDAFSVDAPAGEVIFVTKKGVVKKVDLAGFENAKKAGIIAVSIANGDSLKRALYHDAGSGGTDCLLILASNDRMLKFSPGGLRIMGRQSYGVTGIRLGDDDEVTDALIVRDGGLVGLSNSAGYCKKVAVNEIRMQSRGGGGIASGGARVAVHSEGDDRELALVSASGCCFFLNIGEIPRMARSSRGKRMVDLDEGDSISLAVPVPAKEVK